MAVSVVMPATVWAQETADSEESGEVIVVVGQETRSLGFQTVVEVADYEGQTSSVAEVLANSVGVNVRSLGGLGGFASISIRGASASHTALFVDGVPVSRLSLAGQDLGAFELSSFSKLEVYRGAVPIELGSAAMGGAVNLRTRLGPDPSGDIAQVSTGFGSFGARHLRARLHDRAGKFVYHIGLGYRTARGDYEYFNDNGTLLLPDDDTTVTRQNNGFQQFHGLARGRYEWQRAKLELGSRTGMKAQGIPGVGSVQSDETSLSSVSQMFDAQFELSPRNQNVELGSSAFVRLERQVYQDTMGEVGLGNQHNQYQTISAGGTARLTSTVAEGHQLASGLDASVDSFAATDLLNDGEAPQGRRWNAGAAIRDDIAVTDSLYLAPALRVDYQRTNPGRDWSPIVATPDELAIRSEFFLSPRLSSTLRQGSLDYKASAGRYFRAPTLTELFGDRGFIVGNPTLESETGIMGDLGVVFSPEHGLGVVDQPYLQAAVFLAQQESAIVLMPSAGRAALAQNLGDATLFGLEAAVAFRLWQRLRVAANYTYVDSRQQSPLASYDGKRLPLRPRNELYGRVEYESKVWSQPLGLWLDLAFTSGNFLDAANQSEVPSRMLLGAGLKAHLGEHLLAGFEVKNLTNKRVESITLRPPPRPDLAQVPRAVSDFLGYPLPGRAFYATVSTSL